MSKKNATVATTYFVIWVMKFLPELQNKCAKTFYQKNKKCINTGKQVHYNVISKPALLNNTSIEDSFEIIL